MDQHPGNPSQNNLHISLSEDALREAIVKSGYPLQSEATDILKETLEVELGKTDDLETRFTVVQEEWSYIDSDSGAVRQLDALASREITRKRKGWLSEVDETEPRDFIHHHIDFLIECKQSEHPYVFFLRRVRDAGLPVISGHPYETIKIHLPPKYVAHMVTSIDRVLGIFRTSFRRDATTAISMARTHYAKGGGIELSGEEAFRGIILPITKALKHFQATTTNSSIDRRVFHIHQIFPLVVLRAPLVGVHMDSGEIRMEALPWVRLVRMEPIPAEYGDEYEKTSIDVVHIDFLQEYIKQAVAMAVESSHRLDEFAIPTLTGEANYPIKETRDGLPIIPSGEIDSESRPWYKALDNRITEGEFFKVWDSRRRGPSDGHNGRQEKRDKRYIWRRRRA